MKKYNLIISLAVVVTLIFSACKKEINNVKDVSDTSLKLEGKWQMESINFLTDEAEWNDDVEYNIGNYFGYAPAMFEEIQGVGFQEKNIQGLGKKIVFYNEGDHNQDENKEYWYWNYLNGNNSFEIEQINTDMPPYDFSIKNIDKVEVQDGGKVILFEAGLNSRIVGESTTKTQILPVKITLIKGNPTKNVSIFLKGEPIS